MGTNYHAARNHCDSCGRHDPLHICKSHVSFEGHFVTDWDKQGPWQVRPWLTSWAGWKTYLRSDEVAFVQDEYGEMFDVEDFIQAVELSSPEARRRQYDWCADSGRKVDVIEPGADWLDADGFSFYGGGFS